MPLEDAAPLFAALLSVPLPEGRYPAIELTPAEHKQRTFDVLVAWLLAEAERCPVLAVREDLHWADLSTLETLGLVLEQAPTVSMLHVLTVRPEFERPWPGRSHLTPIILDRLERSQVEALITYLARGKALPAEVIAQVVAKADGVPFYVEDLTKAILESGLIREERDRYALTGPLTGVAIPVTLHSRLALLAPGEARDRRELELQVMKLGPLQAAKGYASPEIDVASGWALTLCRSLGDRETLFAALSARWAAHHKMVWIRRGHCSTAEIEELLRVRQADVLAFERDEQGAFLSRLRSPCSAKDAQDGGGVQPPPEPDDERSRRQIGIGAGPAPIDAEENLASRTVVS